MIDLLPAEDLVYVGDTGRYPYGPRPQDEVRVFARELAWSLVKDFDAKAVIVACNTAAAAGLGELAAELPVPVLGGDRARSPGARPGHPIGPGRGDRHGRHHLVRRLRAGGRRTRERPVELTSAACPGFVEFVERGETEGEQVTILAERLLAPVRAAGVDTLLLGCTHYPYLARVIADVMGPEVVLVSSADETAFAARRQLEALGLLPSGGRSRPAVHRFLSSGDVAWFADLGRRLLGPELSHAGRWTPTVTFAATTTATITTTDADEEQP